MEFLNYRGLNYWVKTKLSRRTQLLRNSLVGIGTKRSHGTPFISVDQIPKRPTHVRLFYADTLMIIIYNRT